jgi:hypothetical protein
MSERTRGASPGFIVGQKSVESTQRGVSACRRVTACDTWSLIAFLPKPQMLDCTAYVIFGRALQPVIRRVTNGGLVS